MKKNEKCELLNYKTDDIAVILKGSVVINAIICKGGWTRGRGWTIACYVVIIAAINAIVRVQLIYASQLQFYGYTAIFTVVSLTMFTVITFRYPHGEISTILAVMRTLLIYVYLYR